jgi:hypothetical protein
MHERKGLLIIVFLLCVPIVFISFLIFFEREARGVYLS